MLPVLRQPEAMKDDSRSLSAREKTIQRRPGKWDRLMSNDDLCTRVRIKFLSPRFWASLPRSQGRPASFHAAPVLSFLCLRPTSRSRGSMPQHCSIIQRWWWAKPIDPPLPEEREGQAKHFQLWHIRPTRWYYYRIKNPLQRNKPQAPR